MPEQLQPWSTAIYATIGIVALIVLAVILARLLTGRVRGRKGSRLGISEYYEIDKSRRLVLIRRDEVEHLLLIGGAQDIVVEENIGTSLLSPASAQPAPRQAPRPPVFGNRRPTLRTVENAPNPDFETPPQS